MTYTETENEHHEAISGGIVALRNEVAKLTGSAHDMRSRAAVCNDPERARALYESSAAYADAAYRVGNIVNDFEQAESYRAGAMEAIGPVPSYDALQSRNLTLQSELDGTREHRARLADALNVVDAALGGNGTASPEDLGVWAEGTAKALRRFRGIRDSATNLLDKVGGQYSAHTLVDLFTILLDGDQPEMLAKFKAAVVPMPKLPKISPELGEQIERVTGAVARLKRYEPGVGEIVSGYDVTDVDGDRTVGKITYVDTDAVTVEMARHREAIGWYLGYSSLDRAELRPANTQESATWSRNLQLLKQENPAALKDSALLESGHLDDTTPYVGKLDNGGLFVGLYVGTTDQGRIKLQRPIKTGNATEDWGVRLEEVAPETVSAADPATAKELHSLIDQADREIHGVTE